MKDGLYSDAMILARRMCANEPQELEKIETTFLSHRSELNPVMTLLSVANGQPTPVLVSFFSFKSFVCLMFRVPLTSKY